ncbi:hypothetical protein, partial [Paracidovorax cattleyae]
PAHAHTAAACAGPLPEPLREALHHLARSGQASALRARLHAARADHPGHAALLEQLDGAAGQLDFDRLTRLLREPEDDDTDESA